MERKTKIKPTKVMLFKTYKVKNQDGEVIATFICEKQAREYIEVRIRVYGGVYSV